MKRSSIILSLAWLWISTASAQVGDAHSFGRPMKWRGGFVGVTGILLHEDCSVAPSYMRCVQLLPAPATTRFDEDDLETIVLPANSASARSLLCQVVSPYVVYTIFNPGSQPSQAQVSVSATLRVESPVLADPQLINPITGQPFGGFFEDVLPGAHFLYKTVAASETETIWDTDRSRFCVGGIVSKARLIDYYGLSPAQATAFFAGEITLRLGIRGNTRLVTDGAEFRFGVRFLSD